MMTAVPDPISQMTEPNSPDRRAEHQAGREAGKPISSRRIRKLTAE